jgi:hypothetical protein
MASTPARADDETHARSDGGLAMNDVGQIAPIHAKVYDQQVAEAISRDTGAPVELATKIYKEELRSLTRGARITQFVNVLASRRARIKLQQQRHIR